MSKKWAVLAVLFIFIASLSGCATTRGKQRNEEVQGLQNQVAALEVQVQSRDELINNLKEALKNRMEPEGKITTNRTVSEVKSRPSVKKIQIALKNAGYTVGSVDGKMGKQTKDAVKAFQQANNLTVDGRVGKKTWDLLKEYLYKKAK